MFKYKVMHVNLTLELDILVLLSTKRPLLSFFLASSFTLSARAWAVVTASALTLLVNVGGGPGGGFGFGFGTLMRRSLCWHKKIDKFKPARAKL